MSEARANVGSSTRKWLRAIMVYTAVTFLVAVAGAVVGWMLGSALMGAVFGVAIGYFGCVVGGFLLEDARSRVPR